MRVEPKATNRIECMGDEKIEQLKNYSNSFCVVADT